MRLWSGKNMYYVIMNKNIKINKNIVHMISTRASCFLSGTKTRSSLSDKILPELYLCKNENIRQAFFMLTACQRDTCLSCRTLSLTITCSFFSLWSIFLCFMCFSNGSPMFGGKPVEFFQWAFDLGDVFTLINHWITQHIKPCIY